MKALQARGAVVTQAWVYYRRRSFQVVFLRRIASYQVPFDQVVISSQAALDYWHYLSQLNFKLCAQNILVTSPRLHDYASQLGLQRVLCDRA